MGMIGNMVILERDVKALVDAAERAIKLIEGDYTTSEIELDEYVGSIHASLSTSLYYIKKQIPKDKP